MSIFKFLGDGFDKIGPWKLRVAHQASGTMDANQPLTYRTFIFLALIG